MSDRRLVRIVLDMNLFSKVMEKGNHLEIKCIEGLPEGAQMVGCGYDPAYAEVIAIYEHESFVPVPAGTVPLLMPVEIETIEHIDKNL